MQRMLAIGIVVVAACSSTHGPRQSPDGGSGGGGGIDACYPKECSAFTASCGGAALDDGCGHALACGDCVAPSTCGGDGVDHVCAIPAADRVCRDGWCWEAPSPVPIVMAGMAALSPTDVWAVGARGAVEHFDGATWSLVDAGTSADLHAVWMASATDGWIVGANGTMLRWNGTAWHAVASGTTAALYDVSGASPTAVWVVGEGVTREWNGSAVVAGASNAVTLSRVYAAPDGSVVGVDGVRGYSLAGGAWRADVGGSTTFTSTYIGGLAGSGNTVYAVGQRHDELGADSELAYKWNGIGWDMVDVPGDAILYDAFADGDKIYGVHADDIIDMATLATVAYAPPEVKMRRAFGAGGDVFLPSSGVLPWHRKAGTWTHEVAFGWDIGVHEIAALGDDVWFGGTATAPDPQSTRGLGVVRWNSGIVPLDVAQSAGDETDAIAGASNSDAWVVTEAASPDAYGIVAWHVVNGYVGSGSSPFAHVSAMHVAGDDVLLFADDGIEAIDDTIGSRGWKAVPVAGATSGEHWRAVADLPGGDLVIVGNTARTGTTAPVAHAAMRTAGAWAEIAAPAIEQLCGVTATSATDVWAVGFDGDATTAAGKVAHWNGTAWTVTAPAGAAELCAVAIDGGGTVWTSGAHSPLFARAANGTWTPTQPLFVGSVRALRQVGADLWLAGDDGQILRRQ